MPVLIAVAFITLAERKLLGIIQRRRGLISLVPGVSYKHSQMGLSYFRKKFFYLVKLIWGCIFLSLFLPWGSPSFLGGYPLWQFIYGFTFGHFIFVFCVFN